MTLTMKTPKLFYAFLFSEFCENKINHDKHNFKRGMSIAFNVKNR